MVGEIGTTVLNDTTVGIGLKAIGAVLAIGLTGIGTGNAEMGIGAAAVGAIAKNRNVPGNGNRPDHAPGPSSSRACHRSPHPVPVTAPGDDMKKMEQENECQHNESTTSTCIMRFTGEGEPLVLIQSTCISNTN